MNDDYPIVYAVVPVYDDNEKKKIYGYIAYKCYLINENIIEETLETKYEVVYAKKIDNLNLNNYETLEEQKPLFVDGKCINSTIVDNTYEAFDIAKDRATIKSRQLFEAIAKAKYYPPPSYSRDMYGLKRLIELEKSKLEDRFFELNIIEKYINDLNKKRY